MDLPDLPRVSDPDIMAALPSSDFPREDLENFNPTASLAGPPFVVGTVLAYGASGDDGLERLEQELRSNASNAEDGRYNKTDVWYQPIAPPPGVWDYRCRNCRFYIPGDDDSEYGGCQLVGHEEDPFGGRAISPEAWCAVWMPKDGTEWFDYISRRLEGREP